MLWDGFDGRLTSSKWGKITKCSPDTALRDVQDLVAKDVLRKTNEWGWSNNSELMIVIFRLFSRLPCFNAEIKTCICRNMCG